MKKLVTIAMLAAMVLTVTAHAQNLDPGADHPSRWLDSWPTYHGDSAAAGGTAC